MIRVEVWGDLACFTRPEFKVERVSYDVITPSAARGILDSIYWHPGLKWVVDKIYVLSPIEFTNFKRNEVKSKISGNKVVSAMNAGTSDIYMDTTSERTQRTTMALKNVHYVIEAHFEMTKNKNDSDSPAKFDSISKRRLRKGQCYTEPYFGCREFPVRFKEWEDDEIPVIPVTKDLGYMLYDMDYSNGQNISPQFFRAVMKNGVIDVSSSELMR